MRPVSNWKRAHKMATVWAGTAALAWGSVPQDMQSAMLSAIGVPESRVPAILGLLVIVARLIDQPKVRE